MPRRKQEPQKLEEPDLKKEKKQDDVQGKDLDSLKNFGSEAEKKTKIASWTLLTYNWNTSVFYWCV